MGAQARGMLGSVKMEAHDLAEWSYYPEAGEVCRRGWREAGAGDRGAGFPGGEHRGVGSKGGPDRGRGAEELQTRGPGAWASGPGGRRRSAVSAGSSGRGVHGGQGSGGEGQVPADTRGLGGGDPKCKGVPGTNPSEESDLQDSRRGRGRAGELGRGSKSGCGGWTGAKRWKKGSPSEGKSEVGAPG